MKATRCAGTVLMVVAQAGGVAAFFMRMSAGSSTKYQAGRVLSPGGPGAWDDFKVSGPVVRRVPDAGDGWKMWYYGRSEAFNKTEGLINLPSGYIGLAESSDGMRFNKAKGNVAGGAVFGPREDSPDAFDSLHLGIGDVQWDGEKWVMYYFGGDGEWGPTPYGRARGITMRIGRAWSSDGVSWNRQQGGPVLDKGSPGDFDALFVGWPQIVELGGVVEGAPKGQLGMYYHTFNPMTFAFEVGLATSEDGGETWRKKGPVKLPRGEKGSHRDFGHATRCVVADPSGRRALLMFAECANSQLASCIGVYGSDDGMTWEDISDGPAFKGVGLGSGAWDAQSLGCPSVVVRDGSFYMYYVGFSESRSEGAALGCVGLAISEGFDVTTWKRAEV